MSKYIGTKAVNLSTTSADVTGNADIDGNLTVGGNLTVSGTTITVDHATAQTVDLGDNDKIRLGADYELQLWSDGTTGQISGDINHTGSITTDGLTVDGDSQFGNSGYLIYNNANPDITLRSVGGTASYGNVILDANGRYGSIQFRTGYDGSAISNAQRMKIDTGGDISFYDTSGNAKFFWDASDTSLGVGMSSPSDFAIGDLVVGDGSGARGITIYSGNGSGIEGIIRFADGTSGAEQYQGQIKYDHSGNFMRFYTAASEAMRIDSVGRVGIGVTPTNWYTTGNSILQIGTAATFWGSTNTSMASVVANAFYDQTNVRWEYMNNDYATWYEQVDGKHIWFYAPSGTSNNAITWNEAARIDATGKLMIGKTDTSINVQGHRFDPQGQAQHVGTNDSTLYLNRKSSYGDVANFYYNGSFDGSIQVDNGYINIGSNETRLAFIDSAPKRIIPRKGHSTASDGLIDLGDQGSEFKNLFLSGGVVFGATSGSITSKTLDDYEEGTWTPVTSSGTISNPAGTYTKVGRLVTLIFRWSKITGGSGQVSISGLPYAKQSGAGFDPASGGCMFDGVSTTRGITPYMGGNSIHFYGTASGNNNTWWYLNHSDGSGTDPLECYGSIWYYTT